MLVNKLRATVGAVNLIGMARPTCPPIAADVIIEIGDSIVLIERKNFPPGWAIPGGFVDLGETVEAAARREMREETCLEVELVDLLGIYSRPDRDPRGQTISVVFVGHARGTPKADDDAKAVALFSLDSLPDPLAFDHAEILSDYRRYKQTGQRPTPWTKG
jgi:8-oxo-dGTP diphosphatase